MDRFFDLHNNVALKFQEIQLSFADGIGYLLDKYPYNGTADSLCCIVKGTEKLYKLKKYYEQQLKECADSPDKVKDIEICFRCFDKKDTPCTDCD